MALFLPIIGAVISAGGALLAAGMSQPSDPPAPVVPEPPPPPPVEDVVEPEGVIDEQLNRSRELSRQQSAQSEQFLRLQNEPVTSDSLTKLTATSGE